MVLFLSAFSLLPASSSFWSRVLLFLYHLSFERKSLSFFFQFFFHHAGPPVVLNKPYFARELTKDIRQGLRARAKNQDGKVKVYVVIDACNAEGLFPMWELTREVRLNDFIVLFAGAETQLSTDYTEDGGKFTKTFIKYLTPGVKLSNLAQKILEDMFVARTTSPCIRYSHPSLCDEQLLLSSSK